jgi:hypothetical protein
MEGFLRLDNRVKAQNKALVVRNIIAQIKMPSERFSRLFQILVALGTISD